MAEAPGLDDRVKRGWDRHIADVQRRHAALPPLERVSQDDFVAIYRPIPKSDERAGELYEFDEVKDKDAHHVWTIVETGDSDNQYALPGFHIVNKVGYTLTEKAWAHENVEAVFVDFDAVTAAAARIDDDEATTQAEGMRP